MQNVDFAWIELTNKCNLTCNHCYANSGPHEELEGVLSRKDWINIIENLADQGCKRIQFIGGEASLVNYLPVRRLIVTTVNKERPAFVAPRWKVRE